MKRKIDFQDGGNGGHLGFPIGTILAVFDLQVTPMLSTKFRVNGHLGLGVEAKYIYFQDGRHGGHLGFTICTIIAKFDLQVIPMLPTKFQLAFRFRSRSEKKIFKDGGHGGHLGFSIGTILVILIYKSP